jgi:sec-independent protein translocase protein TatA
MNNFVLANFMGPQGLFILFIVLMLFGAKKLPELARGLGQAIREFSKAKNEIHDEIMREPVPQPRQLEPQVVQAQPAPHLQPVAATVTPVPVAPVAPAPVEIAKPDTAAHV